MLLLKVMKIIESIVFQIHNPLIQSKYSRIKDFFQIYFQNKTLEFYASVEPIFVKVYGMYSKAHSYQSTLICFTFCFPYTIVCISMPRCHTKIVIKITEKLHLNRTHAHSKTNNKTNNCNNEEQNDLSSELQIIVIIIPKDRATCKEI